MEFSCRNRLLQHTSGPAAALSGLAAAQHCALFIMAVRVAKRTGDPLCLVLVLYGYFLVSNKLPCMYDSSVDTIASSARSTTGHSY